jgi:hypothetical protein
MNTVERFARGAVITALGGGAGWISLSHVYKFVMQHSAPGTHWTTGVIVAAVSELMPLGVALHARATGKLGPFAVALLLLAGGFSLWAQIATADPGLAGWAVAAFPTLAFMGLVKLTLSSAKVVHEGRAQEDVPALAPSLPPLVNAPDDDRPEPVAGSSEDRPEPAIGSEPEPVAEPATGRRKGKVGSVRSSATLAEKRARIADARRQLGAEASQAEVGKLAGVSASTVSRFENPPRRKLRAVS